MLISPENAAELLDVSPKTIVRMAKRGDLAWCRVGRQIRIRRDSLAQWVEENNRTPEIITPSQAAIDAIENLGLDWPDTEEDEHVPAPCRIDKSLYDGGNYYSARKLRTPPWVNFDAINDLHRQAREKTARTGVTHHVDHIIPLRGMYVSGLHCEDNLQIITAYENVMKSNDFEQ